MQQVIYLSIPAFAFFLAVEWFVSHRQKLKVFVLQDSITSIIMGTGRLIIGAVLVDAWVLGSLLLVRHLSEAWLHIPTISMNSWWKWALLYLLFDFCFYWMHRGHHVIRIGWAGHVTHHSSEQYNLATALRQSWTESITAIPFWLPVAIVGFPAPAILIVFAINLLYQFLMHTETVGKLGVFEWVINTPSHHRVHHGSDLKYLDKNFAGTFIIWDRLFGTFQEEEEQVHYGLITNIKTYNPIKVAFHEWWDMFKDAARAPGIGAKLATFFRPPGWMPGDDSQTVKVQQRALRQSHVQGDIIGRNDEIDNQHA